MTDKTDVIDLTGLMRPHYLLHPSTIFLVAADLFPLAGIAFWHWDTFVLLMLYFLIPWTSVNLVDYYFVRHGHYAITEIFKPDGMYGRWPPRGLGAYLAGLFAMVPFMVLSFYEGPVARKLGGVDISFIVGIVVAGGLYYLLSRNLDLEAEARAIEASKRALAALIAEGRTASSEAPGPL